MIFLEWSKFIEKDGRDFTFLEVIRVYNMIREERALVKQNGAWKPRRKRGWSALFYPPNGLNFQFCWFNLFFLIAPSWSESNFILFFIFLFGIRIGPSRSELIRPGLAVRVDPVRLLYLPHVGRVLDTFHWDNHRGTGIYQYRVPKLPSSRW